MDGQKVVVTNVAKQQIIHHFPEEITSAFVFGAMISIGQLCNNDCIAIFLNNINTTYFWYFLELIVVKLLLVVLKSIIY